MPSNKALIVLQENSGRVPLPDGVPNELRDVIFGVIDRVSETFENVKTQLQAHRRYDVVYLHTDNACTRANLLNAMVTETKKGRSIDLIVLGHGNAESLALKGTATLTGGESGNIRSLLPEAQGKGVDAFNLRLVYMCNCFGSTLNDDWAAIGAKASVGSRMNDYMPEPMTTFFVHNWLNGQKVGEAARKAYSATVPFYTVAYPPTTRVKYKTVTYKYPCPTPTSPLRMCEGKHQVPDGVEFVTNSKIVETELVVGGNGNLKF